MNFIIKNQEDLSKKLSLNLKATSSNNIVEAFKNLKLKISENTIEITSYNGESCVISHFNILNETNTDAEFLVDAAAFKNIIDKLTEFSASQINVSLDLEKERMYLRYNGIKFNLKIFNETKDFDSAPNLDSYNNYKTAVFNKNALRRALLNTKKCTIKDQARPILETISIIINETNADVFATDGYKLAINTIECESAESFKTSLRASSSISILSDILNNGYDFVEINSNGVYTMAENDDTVVFFKEMRGQLIDYKRFSQRKNETINIKINKKSLENAITATKIGNSTNSPVQLSVNHKESTLLFKIINNSASGDSVEACEIPIPVEIDSSLGDLSLCFNSIYLLDLLSSIYTENCNIIIQGTIEPFFIENENDNNATYLLLPIRISK